MCCYSGASKVRQNWWGICMEQTLCKVVALICIRSCFVIHPGAEAILFGSTRRTLVTVGECYLSLCKHNHLLSSSWATFRMANYHAIPRASQTWRTGCILSFLVYQTKQWNVQKILHAALSFSSGITKLWCLSWRAVDHEGDFTC